jgi:hypothetical protein
LSFTPTEKPAPHFAHEAHAVLCGAAPLVLAHVVLGREKLAHEIAVRAVDLHPREARLLRERGALGEAVDQREDLVALERARRREERPQLLRERDRRGRDALAVEAVRALFSRVIELHPQLRALLGARARPTRERVEVSRVFERDVARLAERAAVDHHVARHDHADRALRPRAVEPLHPRRGDAVVSARERLAHGGLEEAVVGPRAAGEGEGLSDAQGAH